MDIWTINYRAVQKLGKLYADSCYDLDGTRKLDLTAEEQRNILKSIKKLQAEASAYLDKRGFIPAKPLWAYDYENPATHPSSRQFMYDHLMTPQAKLAYGSDYMQGK